MVPEDIWEKFTSGSYSCFKELFQGCYDGLYGYGMKLCGDSDLVEDCIQELFISVWERRDDLTHITSPNVYLYVSLRRNLLKIREKQSRITELDQIAQGEFDIQFGIQELIIKKESKKEQKEELHKALNQLSNKQKEVLYLHYYNGMSYGEIEKILSINRQSVRNHMYRAMVTLRTVLDIEIMRLVISLLIAFIFTAHLL